MNIHHMVDDVTGTVLHRIVQNYLRGKKVSIIDNISHLLLSMLVSVEVF